MATSGFGEGIEAFLPLERPDDPPGVPARPATGARRVTGIPFGRFTSLQVNVDGAGANIPGDAANEPSIAVDPTNHDRMAIGWRQFDTISSNFREAGYGYTSNGGLAWTTGEIESGVFRSDPVLGFDAQGKFFYNSLSTSGGGACRVFPSTDGGMTWGPSTFAYGGDKQWMTNDRTGGMGHDHIWGELPVTDHHPRLARVGHARRRLGRHPVRRGHLRTRRPHLCRPLQQRAESDVCADVHDGLCRSRRDRPHRRAEPGRTPRPVVGRRRSLDGTQGGVGPVLASVETPSDPMDVHFIRSTDGGQTWSSPVRVNDDPSGNGAWQWFGTMSVSPDGRIDAVWNDTRGSADSSISALHYSFSTDGGVTWSANEQASPTWNSRVGWPNQAKIGDYYHMISHTDGADLAWAATFNGEQDVYYLRIPSQTTAVAHDPSGRFRLRPNLPNPFASSTTIQFDMPTAGGRVKLEVFDAGGRRVATLLDGLVGGGAQSARWTGTDGAGRAVKSGIYLCRLESAGRSETRKVMLLRLR